MYLMTHKFCHLTYTHTHTHTHLNKILRHIQRDISIFQCYRTNYHYLGGFKQHIYCITDYVGQKSGLGLAGFSVQDLTRLQCRYCVGLWSHLTFKVLFQAYVVVGRVHFLTAIALIVFWFFKTSSRIASQEGPSLSLGLLTCAFRCAQDNIPFD